MSHVDVGEGRPLDSGKWLATSLTRFQSVDEFVVLFYVQISSKSVFTHSSASVDTMSSFCVLSIFSIIISGAALEIWKILYIWP